MFKKYTIFALIFILGLSLMASRNIMVTTPDVSQKSSVSQRIGISDISVVYYSPAVNKREIWGKLIPYGKIWRVGANENTVICFSHDVRVEGKSLKKGKYGLHMIPQKDRWTVVFSTNHTSWGSYFYKKEEDALRVDVTPKTGEFREWMSFDFRNRQAESAVLTLSWEKLQVPVRIEVDVKKTMLTNLRNELRSLPFWYWQGTYGAAKYCVDNGINFEEALTWIDQSINVEENFQNLMLKSKILEKLKQQEKADKLKTYAMKVAREKDLTQYAYSFARKDRKKCETILLKNIKRFKTWTSYRAIARLYNYFKEKEKAMKYFKLALKKAPVDRKKALSEEINKTK